VLQEREVYLNGEYHPWEKANVHVMSHSFGRGSAIFEVIGFHETPDGPAVFRLDEHLLRFWNSSTLLDMEPPIAREVLHKDILSLVRRSGLQSGFIKVFGYYPEISFNILPPVKKFHVTVCVLSDEEVFGKKQGTAEHTVTACISRWRRLDPETVPIEAKVAANYVNGMVARMECRGKGFDYAILLDTHGFLAEGGTESLFLVRAGRLMTPSLGTVLRSITRKSLLELAEAMGMETFTGRLNPGLLDEADEIFFAGTGLKFVPVRQVDKRKLDDAPGPVTRQLAERMDVITSGCDRQFQRWLFTAI
jgi:branched-chain amino acid aminotransferase